MKKFLALLFVCAGLTAMAVNPVHTGRTSVQKMSKGTMLLKENTMAKQLTKNAISMPKMKVGQPGSLHEFVKTRDLSKNKLMNRAPKRATYTDIEGDWLYSSIESMIENGVATPTWYSFSGLTFEIDSIFEDLGYCEVYLGIMPFLTDPDGPTGSAYSPGYYIQFPDCYAYYAPEDNEFGIFGDWMYKYPLSANRSGSSTYTFTASYWYTGIGNEAAVLGTGDNANIVGTVDWDNGMITFDEPFGPIEAQVSVQFRISSSTYRSIANMVGASTGSTGYQAMAFYLEYYYDYFQNNGYTYTRTVQSQTNYSYALYEDPVFLLPNATHTFDQAFKASTLDTTFVEDSYVMDSVVSGSVPVFAYQNEACDTIFTYNLWNIANYPDVAFTIDANATVNFPLQAVYREDMTEMTEYYHNYGLPYNFTNAFFNFNSTYAPYDQDGVVGYYNTGIDWEDTPCEINADLNEITWNGTEIMDLLYTDDDVDEEGNIAGYYMGIGFTSAWVNNKLTFNYALTLPEPAETWQLGDVNHDGFVDVGDVTALISHILGNTPDVFYFEEANVDQDAEGAYDVGDVTALIAIILGN